jgi:phytoene dehydrogenase-like protein
VKKAGGRVLLNAHVEEIELEGGRAAGVRLRGGARVAARRAVVSNASLWDTQARRAAQPLRPERPLLTLALRVSRLAVSTARRHFSALIAP